MNVLRFTTAGSVDDGKSTLIGRLLYDSKSVFIDQLDAVAASSKRRGTELDLSLLTDGLKDEREQGITIDVAYRYFATPKRNFILADTPGHVQYTRNMVTGASTADAALILVDARHGVVEQLLSQAVRPSIEIDGPRLNSLVEQAAGSRPPLRYRHCPVCDDLMNRRLYGKRSGVIVDRCRDHGLWLDAGELRQLMEWAHAGGLLHHAARMEEEQREQERQRRQEEVERRTARKMEPTLSHRRRRIAQCARP